MNRPIIYNQEELRSFDILSGYKDVLVAISDIAQSFLGSGIPLISGFDPSISGLALTLGDGRIFTQAPTDPTDYGTLASDATTILQVGHAAGQTLTLSTAGLAAGQGYWALVQVKYQQNDYIRSGDPNSGILPYYNVANPASPLNGSGGSGSPQNTVRRADAVVTVKYGTPAVIGSEVPPNPDTDNQPIYLIDLVYGQTTVDISAVHVASPSLGGTVPSNYPRAPFLAGLLKQHHTGVVGQAPKVVLTNGLEVQGILPYENLPPDLVGFSTAAAKTVFAGPVSGSPALPTFRQLQLSDLPSQNPVNANFVLAGPASGSPAVPNFRALVPADFPSVSSGSFSSQVILTNGSGNWVVPAGVYVVFLSMAGGGGGGGGSNQTKAGGGGGGAAAIRHYPLIVQPGMTLHYIVGEGGVVGQGSYSGGGGSDGGVGTNSAFDCVICLGGHGGITPAWGAGSPGAGGVGGIPPCFFPNGADGSAGVGAVGGAGGLSMYTLTTTGVIPNHRGTGGVGADAPGSGATGANGHVGENGFILLVW